MTDRKAFFCQYQPIQGKFYPRLTETGKNLLGRGKNLLPAIKLPTQKEDFFRRYSTIALLTDGRDVMSQEFINVQAQN